MKIAIIYNRESKAVINLFGLPNREKYGLQTINTIKNAVKACGHQVKTFEGDKNIIKNLEAYMPAVIAGERPGLVLNLSYGIQGRSRYTHIPSVLEMIGIPYIGSDPLSHGLALDKVMTKMILMQKGIPTPKFAVLEKPDDVLTEDLQYPLIVKPKNEAVSYGLKIVNNETELREGAQFIYDTFKGPTLVEEYIDGREINVGVLGNDPVKALPPLELVFKEGDKIYTYEDKSHKIANRVESVCPAQLSEKDTQYIQSLAISTFKALGCFDSARIDFRIGKDGQPTVLEINSMASLSPTGSYVKAAQTAGLNYNALVQELISIASKRYFGNDFIQDSVEIQKTGNSQQIVFDDLIKHRAKIEDQLKYWTSFQRDKDHPFGISKLMKVLDQKFSKLGLKHVEAFTNATTTWAWETSAGYENGVLLVVPIDIPQNSSESLSSFRIEEDRIFGSGIASSNAGITCIAEALKSLMNVQKLHDRKIGVFAYTDESDGMRYSGRILRQASKLAKEVIILQPGSANGKAVTQRRGFKKINIVVERSPITIGRKTKQVDIFNWITEKIQFINGYSQQYEKLAVAVNEFRSKSFHMMQTHKIEFKICITYLDPKSALDVENEIMRQFKSRSKSIRSYIGTLEERPPMLKSPHQSDMILKLRAISEAHQLPFGVDSRLTPSAGGDIAPNVPVLCGMSPSAENLYTNTESINRLELLQKTVLLSMYLLGD